MKRSGRRAAFWGTVCGALVTAAVLVPLWVTADSGEIGLTATLYSDVIRFEADGVASLRVVIYDLAENELWNSAVAVGDTVDWDRANAWGERLANGYYLYLAQGWDEGDRLILNRAGKVVLLPGNLVELRAAPVATAPPVESPFDPYPRGDILVGTMAVDEDHSTEKWAFKRVGIGTTDPAVNLDVVAGSSATTSSFNAFRFTAMSTGTVGDGFGVGQRFDLENHTGSTQYAARFVVEWEDVSAGDSTIRFATADNSSVSEKVRITSDGRVGIGTTSPGSTLEVAGVVHSTAGGFKFPDGTTQATATGGDTLWTASGDDIHNTNNGAITLYAGGSRFLHDYGTRNTFLGVEAGNFSMTGGSNTAVGEGALSSNATGYHNTAVGQAALSANTGGYFNTAVGEDALTSNTTGDSNTAVGEEALASNTEGDDNTAVGEDALAKSTTGVLNTAVGKEALQDSVNGDQNTAVGAFALENSTGGDENTAVGARALRAISSGCLNVAVGHGAGDVVVTGSRNTLIGCDANVGGTSLTNATAIGYNAQVDASHKVRIGNTNVTVIEGQVDWTYTSDRDAKESFRPVDRRAVLQRLAEIPVTSWNYVGQDPQRFRHYGCVSQDFFAAFGHDELGTIGSETTLTGSDVDGILMASTQALYDLLLEKDAEIASHQAQIDELRTSNESLRTQMNDVLARLAALEVASAR